MMSNCIKLALLLFFYLPKPFNGIKRVSPKITMACLSHIRNNNTIYIYIYKCVCVCINLVLLIHINTHSRMEINL